MTQDVFTSLLNATLSKDIKSVLDKKHLNKVAENVKLS